MTITERRHLGRQEESVDESAVQLRDNDPATPVENQIWINTAQNYLKARKDGETIVLVDGGLGASLEIPPDSIIDLALSRSYFKDADGNIGISSIQNNREGMISYISISNNNPAVEQEAEINIPNPNTILDGNYFTINSASNQSMYYFWFNFDGMGVDPNISNRTGVEVVATRGVNAVHTIQVPNGDVISSGHHFFMNNANNINEYYVWYNVDGQGNDPLVTGKTGIQVPVLSTDLAEVIAEKTRDAIDGNASFNATFTGNEVTITNAQVGPCDLPENVDMVGLVIALMTSGLNPDTIGTLANKVTLALNDTGDFIATASVGNITIVNIDTGFCEEPTVGDMPSGFTTSVSVSGSGRIKITFPMDVLGSEVATSFGVVESGTVKLFKGIRINGVTLMQEIEYQA